MLFRFSGGREGWGGFAVEIAVVVIGVLIALGAQQAVETMNDRSRSERAVAALQPEVGDIDFTSSEIQIAAPCIFAQLDRVQQQLLSDDRTPLKRFSEKRLSAGDFVIRSPSRVWATDIWESVSSSDILRRTKPELDRELGSFYSSVTAQRGRNERVRRGVVELNALSYAIPEDRTERFRLITQVEQIRGEVALMDLVAGQLRDRLAAAKMLQKPARLEELLGRSGTITFCREQKLPLGKLRPADASASD